MPSAKSGKKLFNIDQPGKRRGIIQSTNNSQDPHLLMINGKHKAMRI